MRKTIQTLICLSFLGVLPAELAAAEVPVSQLAGQLDIKQQETHDLEQEIEFAVKRRKSTEEKLKTYQQDIEEKQHELKMAQLRYSGDPSAENEQFLRNAEQRLELSQLSIKSRVASVARLEAKESELSLKLEVLQNELGELQEQLHKEQLAQKVEQKTQSLKSKMESQTSLLQQRLEALQRENERLRQVALVETQKREEAEEQASMARERARAAELALQQYQQQGLVAGANEEAVDADDSSLGARERALAEMERVKQKLLEGDTAGPAANLFLKGDDGTEYGMFQYLGAQQYRTDAVIHDSSARFRVAGRTYQVKISNAGVGQEFVFLYDLSNPSKPRFVTFKKALLEGDGGVVAKE